MTYKTYQEAKLAYPDCDAIFTTGEKWDENSSNSETLIGTFMPAYFLEGNYYDCDDCNGKKAPYDGGLCIRDDAWVFYMDNNKSNGGSCNYYMVDVINPTTLPESYTIECNDLIEALGLSFKEANIIKEIFRTANERTNGNGKEGNTEKRAAEKILFFAIRNAIASGVDVKMMINEMNIGG